MKKMLFSDCVKTETAVTKKCKLNIFLCSTRCTNVSFLQGGFRDLEPAQAADGAAAVLDPSVAPRRHPLGGALRERRLPLPEGQVLRHQVRHRRQARAVRQAGGRPQVLVHVEGEGHVRIREAHRQGNFFLKPTICVKHPTSKLKTH